MDMPIEYRFSLWSRVFAEAMDNCPYLCCWELELLHREQRCWELAAAAAKEDPNREWLVLPPGEVPEPECDKQLKSWTK